MEVVCFDEGPTNGKGPSDCPTSPLNMKKKATTDGSVTSHQLLPDCLWGTPTFTLWLCGWLGPAHMAV
jgi:hypothetical protein